jgi:uncharacterized protein (TIGR03083 family)
MLSIENLMIIESEGRRLGLAARRDPERPVPQYPGWTLADLVSHTASIFGQTAQVCRQLPTESVPLPTRPEGVNVHEWYDATLDEMLAVLTDADPKSPCWGFGPGSNVGHWECRVVAETGVHRWDADQAFGEEDDLNDLVARQGLDEYSLVWLPLLSGIQTLKVTATDLGASWVYGKGVATASVDGSASALVLRLMSRSSSVALPDDWTRAVDGLAPTPKP